MKQPAATFASDLFPNGPPSEARQQGRRLVMKFIGSETPILERLEFYGNDKSQKYSFLHREAGDKEYSFIESKGAQALPIFFLDYLCAQLQSPPKSFEMEGGTGSLAASLGYALAQKGGKWYTLFTEFLPQGGKSNCVRRIFGGDNFSGYKGPRRIIRVNADYLPPECFEIVWKGRTLTAKETPDEILEITRLFRAACNLPPSLEPKLPKREEIPKKIEKAKPKATKAKKKPAKKAVQKTQSKQKRIKRKESRLKSQKGSAGPKPAPSFETPKSETTAREIAEEIIRIAGNRPQESKPQEEVPAKQNKVDEPSSNLIKPTLPQIYSPQDQILASNEVPQPKTNEKPVEPQPEVPYEQPKSETSAGEVSKKIDGIAGNTVLELKLQETGAKRIKVDEPPFTPIEPGLFQIHNPQGYTWDDGEALLNFGNDESDADVWRIRDANEGVLIMGAVGSGKTSGSGAHIARAYLLAGFGGLVLTAKPDEAKRWLKMCKETGRENDCIHVTVDSGHKLNILHYESQRPGRRVSITDDLIALFRSIITAMSRDAEGQLAFRDDFWNQTTDQLMRKLIDLFLLSDEPLTIRGLSHFLSEAPTNESKPWGEIPEVADLINRAHRNAQKGTTDDKAVFNDVFDYWTSFYPKKIPDITRGGFIAAFSAMADILTGRGIYDIIGTQTNLTPEMILSGKVFILDFPIKANIKGGQMIQAAFKLLFQQAAERRVDKGLPTARPCFLWEDEGHLFFSHHDVDFQPTTRDCRISHVIISQNLHNFFHQGSNQHTFEAVFSAMNTHIYHTNGDTFTNRYASARIGESKKLRLTSDGLLKPIRDKDISFLSNPRPEEVDHVGRLNIVEETKASLPPEDFAKLKRGGDGTCEAVIIWLSHQFAANGYRNFCVHTFEQEPRT